MIGSKTIDKEPAVLPNPSGAGFLGLGIVLERYTRLW